VNLRPFIQTTILIFVSVLAGFVCDELGINFWVGLFLGLALQFLIFNIYSNILTIYVNLKNKKLENERIKEFSYQGSEVTCPCYKKIKSFVPIRLNTDNSYLCQECKKEIAVYIDVSTAITTQPIDNTKEALKTIVDSYVPESDRA
jgi:uncharacterized protein YlaI